MEHESGQITVPVIRLTDSLVQTIEEVFLNPDGIDPMSDLMQTICPPRQFPWDYKGDCFMSDDDPIDDCQFLLDDLRLKTAIFREADLNPNGLLGCLTRSIFCLFVLPTMLNTKVWMPGNSNKEWFKNLYADVQISRTIRHVLRVHDARAAMFPGSQLGRRFKFKDNDHLLQQDV